MKRSRFSEEQIIGILKEHEAGVSVADVCRKHGVSDASIYKWKAKFGGMDVSEAKRLKTLEDENTAEAHAGRRDAGQRGAERSPGKEVVTPASERKAVAHLMNGHGMSERRACKAIGSCRMTMRYKTTRADDAILRERMKAIAHERRRFGYRRLHVMLKREGYVVNHKRLFRLYREEKLTVRRRGGRKRAHRNTAPMRSRCAQRTLVAGLRVRSTHRRPPLPHPGHRRRLHPRMPGAGGGHLAIWPAGGAGAGPVIQRARQAEDDRQRQWQRTHLQRDPAHGPTDRVAWHYIAPGQADAERFH